MLKVAGYGIIIFLLLAFASIWTGTDWLINCATVIGIGCLILPVIMGNAIPNGMAPGTHMQGHETKEDRSRKNRWSIYLLSFGLPNLLGAILVYLFLHQ